MENPIRRVYRDRKEAPKDGALDLHQDSAAKQALRETALSPGDADPRTETVSKKKKTDDKKAMVKQKRRCTVFRPIGLDVRGFAEQEPSKEE